jgi:hypothetical protein
MLQALRPHPDFPSLLVAQVEVELGGSDTASLMLRYRVKAAPSDLRLPAPAAPVRADGLWQHSCFELFVRAAAPGPYFEFNFSPSSAWSAYRFDSHRSGMTAAPMPAPPRIRVHCAPDLVEVSVQVELGLLAELTGASKWHVGLSAVIEEADGRKSYWALAHPAGPPDFHHSDCFALELAAPSRP